METLTPATAGVPHRSLRRPVTPMRVIMTLAVLLLAGAAFVATSLAVFTDTETITDNEFAFGNVDLTLSSSSALVSINPMVPGDTVTAPLTVTNSGNLDLRYAMVSTTTENPLAAELVLTVKSGVTTCDDANWTVDGSTLYSNVLGTTAGTNVIGDPTQGADGGDRVLAASANEVLCMNVTLPISATAGEGLSTTATFTFEAEQTDNNP